MLFHLEKGTVMKSRILRWVVIRERLGAQRLHRGSYKRKVKGEAGPGLGQRKQRAEGHTWKAEEGSRSQGFRGMLEKAGK